MVRFCLTFVQGDLIVTVKLQSQSLLSDDSVYQGIIEICTRRLWKQAALSTGDPVGNLVRGATSTGQSERQLEKGSGNRASVSMERLWGEPKGRAPILGNLKATSDNSRKALKMELLSPYRSPWGEHGGRTFQLLVHRRASSGIPNIWKLLFFFFIMYFQRC